MSNELNKNKELDKLIQLLGQEVTAENDEQLLSEVKSLKLKKQRGFAETFRADVTGKLAVSTESFEGKLIQMFKRVAVPAAAAILLLLGGTLLDTNSLNDVFSSQSELDELVLNGAWDLSEEFMD